MVEHVTSDKELRDKIRQLEQEKEILTKEVSFYQNQCTRLTTYGHILEKTREHISILDKNYIYLAVSQRYLQAHKKTNEEIVGHTVPELLGEEIFNTTVRPNLERCFSGIEVNYQAWFKFDGLGHRYMDVTYHPIQETGCDQVFHAVVSAHDLTELYEAQAEQRLAKSFFDNTSEGIVITDSKGIIINVNSAFSQISGYGKHEVIGKNAGVTKSDKHDDRFYQDMWESLKQTGRWQGEIWDKHKLGQIYPKFLAINEITDKNDNVINYIGIFSDISALKNTQNELEKLAYYDMLTNLPNRPHFFETLDHQLALAKRHKQHFSVLFIDLDGFKAVNDKFGHEVGDQVLKQVSKKLKNCVRKTDFVARLGGDEFTVILLNTDNIKQITQIAVNVNKELASQFKINNNIINIGASIGIFCYPNDGKDVHSILSKADDAMYVAKNSGKGCYSFVSER